MRNLIIFAAATAILLAPLGQAHAAPDPAPYETRILHDYSDDSTLGFTSGPGFDVIALDAREAYLDGEEALVLRLVLNGGCPDGAPQCPEITNTISFSIDGTPFEVNVDTADGGETFTGNAAAYAGPFAINDEPRFAIEAWVLFSDMGVEAGSVLSAWTVVCAVEGVPVDSMPAGLVAGQPDEVGGETVIDIGEYTVKAPDYYLSLAFSDAKLTPMANGAATVSLGVSNLVLAEQEVTFTVAGDAGISGSIMDADGNSVESLLVGPNFTSNLTVEVAVGEMADGFLTVTGVTDLGGMATARLPVKTGMPMTTGDVMSPDIMAGESWNFTFTEAGKFSYHNHHMPSVMGEIHIEHDDTNGTESHTVTFDGAAFDPSSLEIEVGDTVTFVNGADGMLMIMGGTSEDGGEHHHPDDNDDGGFLGIPGPSLPMLLAGVGALLMVRRAKEI